MAQDAKANSGLYVSGSVGWLVPEDVEGTASGIKVKGEYEDGFHITGALGYRFGNGFRVEGELGYAQTGFDKVSGNGTSVSLDADVDIYTLMLNGFYDIKTGTAFTPYVGAGVGVAYTEVGTVTARLGNRTATVSGDSSTDMVMMGEVGVGISVAKNVTIAPAYRYTYIQNGDNGFDDDTAHTFKVGLRYDM